MILSGKREKKYDYPKFQYRQTSEKKKSALATAVEKYIGPRTVPTVQKNIKIAINFDITAHSIETEK